MTNNGAIYPMRRKIRVRAFDNSAKRKYSGWRTVCSVCQPEYFLDGLLYRHEGILAGADADFLGVLQTGLPVGVRMKYVEFVLAL